MRRPNATTVAGHVAVVVVLVVLAIWMTARVWIDGHPSSTVLCQCGDPGQAVWFMSWVPWAITHGHNPLFTTRMLAGQGGANLLESTSYLLQSFVLTPVTWLFGPTASFNVASVVGPVLSGWAMYAAAGRLTRQWVARVAAGVLWAYSPFLLGAEIYGHLNFTWLFFPPLLFLGLYALLAERDHGAIPVGIGIGVLVAVQFFAGTEPLLITALAAGFGLVLAAVMAPRAAWAARRRIAIGFGASAATAIVLLAYPLYFLFKGPQHVSGPPWAVQLGTGIPAIVRPGPGTHVISPFVRLGGYFGHTGPGQSFLGLGLLVVLAVALALNANRRVAYVLAIVGSAAWVCSLGPFLLPLSASSVQSWLLWKYLQHLPLVQNIGPPRFALITVACAAGLLALGLGRVVELAVADSVAGARGKHGGATPRWRKRALLGGAAVVTAAALVAGALPIATTYTWPMTMHSATVPVWFQRAAAHVSPKTYVLTYPYASSSQPDAMYWQAQEGLPFVLVGGRALIPGADGHRSQHVDPFTGADAVLMEASFGAGLPPLPTSRQVGEARGALRRWHVSTVVVVARGRAPAWAVTYFSEALARLPRIVDGAAVWSGVRVGGDRGGWVLPASTAARCAAQPISVQGLNRAVSCLRSVRPAVPTPHA